MRAPVDAERVRLLARDLSRATREPTVLYLTGGATAVIEGWRDSTVDIDVRFEPERDELLRRVATAKNALDINIELVSPPDFVPELPEWRERSPFVFQEGQVTVRHFDPYSQALAKVERGFEQDLADVRAMIDSGLIRPEYALELFASVEDQLFRYPSIDAGEFAEKVRRAFGT